MNSYSPGPYTLSEAENERIFRDRILPQRLAGVIAQTRPVLVIVGSQTGAGKTAITRMIRDALDQRGGAAHINMDFYNPYHPLYDALRATDPANADVHLCADGERWWDKAQHYAITQRCDVIIESALQSEANFEDIVERFTRAGYRVDAALMAVPAALSRQGILARYLEEFREFGQGRLVSVVGHDRCYDGVLRAAASIDHGNAVHAVSVFRRGNVAVYSNHHGPDRGWRHTPTAQEAVEVERSRPLSSEEAADFRATQARLTRELGPSLQTELDAIAELAAAVIGPVPHWSQRPHGALDDSELSYQADVVQRTEQQLENARSAARQHTEKLAAAVHAGQGPEVLAVQQTFRRLGHQAGPRVEEHYREAVQVAQKRDEHAVGNALREVADLAEQHESHSRRLDLLQAEQQLRSTLPEHLRWGENHERAAAQRRHPAPDVLDTTLGSPAYAPPNTDPSVASSLARMSYPRTVDEVLSSHRPAITPYRSPRPALRPSNHQTER